MDICTKKTNTEFVTRITTLDSVYLIDDKYQYPLKDFEIIKIRALDMVKSQFQEKDGKLIWLLEFRPLPEQTELAADFYPRMILSCTRSDLDFKCMADKNFISKFRVFKDFSFSLVYKKSNSCASGALLHVEYNLDIDDTQFLDLKAESLKQIIGSSSNILAQVIDKLFIPETLFETYIQHLYEQW